MQNMTFTPSKIHQTYQKYPKIKKVLHIVVYK